MISANTTSRKHAIQTAQAVLSRGPVYLDTETTGLERFDEIIEISIVDDEGQVVFESLVKPSQPIPYSATMVHGITDEAVQSARAWPIVCQQVREALLQLEVVLDRTAERRRCPDRRHDSLPRGVFRRSPRTRSTGTRDRWRTSFATLP